MSRYPGVSALIEAGGRRSTRQDIADRIATKSTQVQDAQEALADNSIVPNTRVPPAPPTGVFVRPRNRGMDLSWDAPPATDYVATTEAMLVRVSDNVTTIHKFEGKLLAGSINGLNPVEYDVSLQHRNKFGAASGFTTPVRITPTPTIAEQIAADVQVAAGQITGQLGQTQIPTITDPSKLAEEVVKGIAAVANKNLLSLPESKMDSYPVGDWAQVGPKQHLFGPQTVGFETLVSGTGRTWLRHRVGAVSGATDTAIGSGWFYPFGVGRYDLAPATFGILSVRTLNPTVNAVASRIAVSFYDQNKAHIQHALGALTTTPAGSGGRNFVKFQVPAGAAFMRIFVEISTPDSGLLFNDFQLERVASDVAQPTAYATPAVFNGAIGANIIGALDLAAVRAVIGNLTVESSKILSLAAEKFVGGTITGQEFVLAAGGRFRTSNNGTRIDDGGVTLLHGANYNSRAFLLDQKISSLAENAAYAFYHDTTTGFRGPIVRSDGNNTDTARGAVILHATYAGSLSAASSARVEVLAFAAGGQITLDGDAYARNELFVTERHRQRNATGTILQVDSTAIAASTGVLTLAHGLGVTPFEVAFEWNEGGIWRPMVDGVASWRIGATATEVAISNLASTPTSRAVRGVIFR